MKNRENGRLTDSPGPRPNHHHNHYLGHMLPEPMLFDREGPGAGYEELHVVQDSAIGLRAIIALHSTRLGPTAGGIRRMAYDNDEDALADALRLAEGMTLKCAMAGLPAGGAKTVIMDHDGLDRAAAYRAIGAAIDRLDGRYLCGPDVGTHDEDLAYVRETCRFVNPLGNDAGKATARGVLAALRGTLRAMSGDPTFEGRTFVIQGLGSVGMQTAEGLVQGGARVLGCDPAEDARRHAAEHGAEIIHVEAATKTDCDVFVPCALGHVITEDVAAKIPTKAVCGSANNQLVSDKAGDILHERGIAYAPDFVVNAGAVIEGVMTTREEAAQAVRQEVAGHIDGIAATIEAVLRRSHEEGRASHRVALEEAWERVAP